MLIIFGFRSTVRVLATALMACGRCGQTGAHRLVRIRRWFTLFFLPVIPISSRVVQTCLVCGLALHVTAPQAEQVVALSARQHEAWAGGHGPAAVVGPAPAITAGTGGPVPADAPRSPDGYWWWDGAAWQPIPPPPATPPV